MYVYMCYNLTPQLWCGHTCRGFVLQKHMEVPTEIRALLYQVRYIHIIREFLHYIICNQTQQNRQWEKGCINISILQMGN